MSTPYKIYEKSSDTNAVGVVWLTEPPPQAFLVNGDGILRRELTSSEIDPITSRDDGPAIIWDCGTVHYFKNGKKHNEDGPASIYKNYPNDPICADRCTWHLDGVVYTEQTWKEEVFKRQFKQFKPT